MTNGMTKEEREERRQADREEGRNDGRHAIDRGRRKDTVGRQGNLTGRTEGRKEGRKEEGIPGREGEIVECFRFSEPIHRHQIDPLLQCQPHEACRSVEGGGGGGEGAREREREK
jgi:hypothetical protein